MLNTVFRTISMMNIKIHNRHTLETGIGRTSVGSCNRHIVEQAEPLRDVVIVRVVDRSVSTNVVTWRAYTAEDGGRT